MSSLRSRLEMLRREAGAAPAQSQPTLAERLQRLRASIAAVESGGRAAPGIAAVAIRRSATADAAKLARALGGEVVAPAVVVSERRVPLAQRHGVVPLDRVAAPVAGLPEGAVDPRRVVFFDTETTGLAGGTGTVAFLIGLGRVEAGHLVVRQFWLTSFAGERDLLAAAGEWISGVDGMVTYNGRSFDLPLVAARCRLAGASDRFSDLWHLDLLGPTRRAFARRWEDCRLTTAERRLLRFERVDDLPGWLAPESWLAYIRRGDVARLPRVAEHNFWDIVSLAALVPALAEVHAQPGAWEADVLAVARSLIRAGEEPRALELLREHQAMLDTEGLLELAYLYRRAGAWREARAIWEPLAELGVAEAIERLAKYYEHVRRDYATALALANRLPPGEERERRRARLLERLNVGAPST